MKAVTGTLIFAVLCLLLTACIKAQVKLTRVYSQFVLDRPIGFQTPPDSSGRIMVVTQRGKIYSIQTGAVPTMDLLLDLSDTISAESSELGLLGLTFHPKFKQNGYFYLNYTVDNPLRTIIARYTMSPPASNTIVPRSRIILFEIRQPYSNHKGGCLAFGPDDGYLYIGLGDGGSAGDPQNHAQDKKSLLGKILRVDVDTQSPGKNYGIPQTNPSHTDTSMAEEVYAYGFRNPWRFSFDPVTHMLWVGDVGQDKYEEIDTVRIGRNYGWRVMEGKHCYNPTSNCDETGLEMPVWDYGHDKNGGDCITGGYVYRGKAIPFLSGKYVYADFISLKLWALSIDAQGAVKNELLLENTPAIPSFGIGPDHELYACDYGGKLYKIEQGPTSREQEQSGVPGDFRLEQNYPNPFNGATIIPFQIATPSHAVLEVYDALGRLVATLVDSYYQAGRYSVQWDAGALASGVYSYRLTAGNSTATRLLVLQR
ncbi:MAG TPA: PQQ-dependent sugar dehydrogenase [Bacteroidota bacterium]|nr:PQQ-dependent sugar dehydrogenase [Bacteroidota bacterium]